MKPQSSHSLKWVALVIAWAPGIALAQKLISAPEVSQSIETVTDRGLFRATDIANADPSTPYVTPGTILPASSRPLVISAEGLSETVLQSIDEDMRIMAHVLSDRLGTDGKSASWASGIPLLNYARESNTRDLFINGTGALFFLNVDFPLAGPAPKKDPVKEEPKDTAWERARRQVLGAQDPSNPGHAWPLPNLGYPIDSRSKNQQRARSFQPERVDTLLENLADAIRSAANIRALNAEDRVWVVVSGPASLQQMTSPHSNYPSRHQPQAQFPSRQDIPENNPNARRRATVYTSLGGAEGTRLTLSASKQDIDEFDAGILSAKEFLKRIQHHAR